MYGQFFYFNFITKGIVERHTNQAMGATSLHQHKQQVYEL